MEDRLSTGAKVGEDVTQAFTICGDVLFVADNVEYVAGMKCNLYNELYRTYDYIFVEECNTSDCYLAKIHSIYIEQATRSLCMEIQHFPIRGQLVSGNGNHDNGGQSDNGDREVIIEVFQTLLLRTLDLATVFIKPVSMMFIPPSVSEDLETLRKYIDDTRPMYVEHPDTDDMDMETDTEAHGYRNEDYDSNDSFIASEGTPSVYSDMSRQSDEMDCVCEDSSQREDKKMVKVDFFYNKLMKSETEIVLAVDPTLLDLLWSYNSDVRDTVGEAYITLKAYISKEYFSGISEEALEKTKEPRYMLLKDMFEQAIYAGDGSLIDPYQVYMILTS